VQRVNLLCLPALTGHMDMGRGFVLFLQFLSVSGEMDAGYLTRSGEELESFTNDWQPCLAVFVAWQVA
jgi:hypothetical protein